MLQSLVLLAGVLTLGVNGGPLIARDDNSTLVNGTTTQTLTVVPVPVEPTSTSISRSYSTKYFTTVDDQGKPTTITGIIPLATTTRSITTVLSYLSTTLTYASTITYDAQYEPDAFLVNRCHYFGFNCPTPTILTGPVGTLISKDRSISLSSYLSQCSKTIDMSSVTKDESSLFTTVSLLPPLSLGGTPVYTTVTTMRTKPPESKAGCCGPCTLTYSTVDVFFFPPAEWGTANCIPRDGTLPTAVPTNNVNATFVPEGPTTTLPGSSFVNSNGYTFVSPSVYVAFTSVSGSNICGQVGEHRDNFTLAFAPGELSTEYRPQGGLKFPAFATWPWDVNSVVCGDKPIIAFPEKLRTAVDPAWGICSASSGSQWGGIDPPFALTPQPNLAVPTEGSPKPTVTPPAPITKPGPAQPQLTPKPSLEPSQPEDGNQQPGNGETSRGNNEPTSIPDPIPSSNPGNPNQSPNELPNDQLPSSGNVNGDPQQDNSSGKPDNGQINNPDNNIDNNQKPPVVIIPVTTTNSNGQTATSSVFSLVPGGLNVGSQTDQDPGQPIASQFGSQPSSTSSPGSPSGVESPRELVLAAGTTLTAGGPTITIDGTGYALGTDGLTVGTSVIPLPTGTSVIATGAASTETFYWLTLSLGAVIGVYFA